MRKNLLIDLGREIEKIKPKRKIFFSDFQHIHSDCIVRKITKMPVQARKTLTVSLHYKALLDSNQVHNDDVGYVSLIVDILEALFWLEIYGVFPELSHFPDSLLVGNNWWILEVDSTLYRQQI
jgi:hypothetical protein